MSTSPTEIETPIAQEVTFENESLSVHLQDGRTISVPVAWYPRLLHGTPEERKHWRLIGKGEGINWESLDEDISVAGLLEGRKSMESPASIRRWLDSRDKTPAP